MPEQVERRLVLAARHDPQARAQLIEEFLPLVASVARIYRGVETVDSRELMQEGVVGLLRALERYDLQRTTPFWAYASWWVRQAMQQLVCELTRPVVLSDRAVRQLARLRDAERELGQAHGTEPSNAQIADCTGLSTRQIQHLRAADRFPRGLDEPVHGEEGPIGALRDTLADPRAEDPADQVRLTLGRAAVRQLLGVLTERERGILRARYGFDGPEQSRQEVGSAQGVSPERVRQIEERALEKLGRAEPAAAGAPPGRLVVPGAPR
jgi:RNA polymerase primary sigma factor